jgi:filamentous hemagglutinin family protein
MCGVATLAVVALDASPASAIGPGDVAAMQNVASVTSSGSTTTITPSHDRSIVDWNAFNISSGETLQFLFPSGHAITLNRVSEGSATINGNLNGCIISCPTYGGNIWIYAADGILFGANALVNTGGLLATTSPMLTGDADFLNSGPLGTNEFTFGPSLPGAGISVQGGASINSSGGTLAFVAPIISTENNSSITTPAGASTVHYRAVESYRVQFQQEAGSDLDLLTFEVPASDAEGSDSLAPITLRGDTAAGNVFVASVSKGSVMNALISAEGTIVANTATSEGGHIVLSGDSAVGVAVAGTLQGTDVRIESDAAATVSGTVIANTLSGDGGSIIVTGETVALKDGSLLDASGSNGGLVLVGGDVHGGAIAAENFAAGSVETASVTRVSPGAEIRADGDVGSGGNVVVWSDQLTAFEGSISATGNEGNGGFAEVSGAVLGFRGRVDLGSVAGLTGTLLLDPVDIIVNDEGPSDGIFDDGEYVPSIDLQPSIILNTDLNDALQNANIIIDTAMGDFDAAGTISLNAPVSNTGHSADAGDLTLIADSNIAINSDLDLGDRTLRMTAGGSIVQTTGASVITAGILTGTSVGVTALMPTGGNQIEVLGAFNSGSDLSLLNARSLNVQGTVSADNLALGADGDLTLSGNVLVRGVPVGAGTLPGVLIFFSSGEISQLSGTVTAGILSGFSEGSTTLGTLAAPINNHVDSITDFSAGIDFSLTNADAISLNGSIFAGQDFILRTNDISLNATEGSIYHDGSINSSAQLEAGRDIILQTGNVTMNGAAGANDASYANISVSSLTAGRDILLRTGDQTISLGSNSGILASGWIAGGLSAGQDVILTTGNVSVTGPIARAIDTYFDVLSGGYNVNAGRDVIARTGEQSIDTGANTNIYTTNSAGGSGEGPGNITVGRDVSIETGHQAIDVASSNGCISFSANAYIDSEDNIAAGRNITLATGSVSVTDGDGSAPTGDSSIYLGGLIDAAGTGTQVLTLRSSGPIVQEETSEITADILTGSGTGSVTLSGEFGVLDAFRAEDDFTLDDYAGSLEIRGADVSNLGFTGVAAGDDVQITAENITVSGTLQAGEDIDLGASDSIDVAEGGSVEAGESVDFYAEGGDISVAGNVQANDDVDFYAPDSITVLADGSVTSGASANASAPSGGPVSFNADAITVNGSVAARGAANIATGDPGGQVWFYGNRITVGGDITADEHIEFTTYDYLASPSGIIINAGGSVSAGDGVVGNPNAHVFFDPDTIVVAGNVQATGDVELNAYTSINVLATGNVGAGGNVSLSLVGCECGLSGTPLISIAGSVTAGAVSASGDLIVDTLVPPGPANISITGNLTAADEAIFLSDGSIQQTGPSVIDAATLTGSASGAATFNSSVGNRVDVLGAFTAGAGFAFTNGQTLNVQGPIVPGADLALTTIGANSNLNLNTNLNADEVALNAGGSIIQNSGIIDATTLTGSSGGSATMNAAGNSVDTLGSFGAGTDLNFRNGQTLNVQGTIAAGADVALTTIGANSNLNLNANLTADGVVLNSAGSIAQSGGVIDATTLTGTSTGATTLNGANRIDELAAFNAAAFQLTNAQTLDVHGEDVNSLGFSGVTSGADLAIRTTGAGSDLIVSGGSLTVSNANTVTLDSQGAITQSGGTLAGGTVSLTAVDDILISTDAQEITAGSVTIASLTGAVVQNGGTISAPDVEISAATDILIGELDFTNAAAALAPDQINVTLGSPPILPTGTSQVFINTGALTLAAAGKIVQQNTGTAAIPDGIRVAAESPLIRIIGEPSVVDLFVRFTEGLIELPPLDVALSPLVEVDSTSNSRRINGCIIHVACAPATPPNVFNFPWGETSFSFSSVTPPLGSMTFPSSNEGPNAAVSAITSTPVFGYHGALRGRSRRAWG